MINKRRIHSFDHLHLEAEIVQLHQFFQDWYNGDIRNTKEIFSRLVNALADGFRIIMPDGAIIERNTIIEAIERDYNTKSAMRIWIEDVRVQRWFDDHVLASYQEWQEIDGNTTVRISSVLFKEKSKNPNGLEWLYVHETWLKIDALAQ